jgi:hypothetical protein
VEGEENTEKEPLDNEKKKEDNEDNKDPLPTPWNILGD